MKFVVLLPILLFFNFGIFCYGHNSNRIWNGVNAPIEKYPNIVKLWSIRESVYGVCTGTIISSRHVLTAAHCVTEYNEKNETVLINGSIHLSNEKRKWTEQVFFTFLNVYTKGYDGYDISKDDIAIIEFNENLKYTPILLAKNYQESDEDIGIGFGYGRPGPAPMEDLEELMKVNMFISKECKANDALHHFICAGNTTHRTDRGDSGGPLFITYKNQMYEIGLVFGGALKNGTKVASNQEVGLYTRLSVYCDWIEETTKGEAKCHEVGKAEPPLDYPPQTQKSIQPLPTTTITTPKTDMMPTSTATHEHENNDDGNGAISKNIFVILLILLFVNIFL